MSGKPDYDVGDLVECIYAPNGHLSVGSVWRALELFPPQRMYGGVSWGVTINGPMPADGVWFAHAFRKIRPASDEFTRQMRSLRPIKAREDA